MRSEDARREAAELELALRSILKLFADGRLVYKNRVGSGPPVERSAERLRQVREARAC